MSNRINPIHWERRDGEPTQAVDLRTLPEDVKVAIMKAAIRVAVDVEAGAVTTVDSSDLAEEGLDELVDVINNMSQFMHEVPDPTTRAAKEPAQHDYVEAPAPDWRIA